jgi:hypothetical protein
VRAMSDAPPEEPKRESDLASIGLLAYFVLLILIVGVLLILPALR